MPQWSSFTAFLADALRADPTQRQTLVDQLLVQQPHSPWISGDKATFFYAAPGTTRVAVNMDTIQSDPPFLNLAHLSGTSLWYATRTFERDDLLDYLLAINDPATPLAQERDIVGRMGRHWRTDPRNPLKMSTALAEVSVLRMDDARPLPDWAAFAAVPRGRVIEHSINSAQLGFANRKVWVSVPYEYDQDPHKEYPLLIFMDGQWAVGPLQLPAMADTLVKHGKMTPSVIAMVQSGGSAERNAEYLLNDKHFAFTFLELLPFLQLHYRLDITNMGIGGVSLGAVAAAHTALKNPAVFERLVLISPPLGKGADHDKLEALYHRLETSRALPKRIFQSVGRYEGGARFLKPAQKLRDALSKRADVQYQFVQTASSHGFVGFKSVLPEALAWAYEMGFE